MDNTEFAQAVCAALNVDPAKVSKITIEITAEKTDFHVTMSGLSMEVRGDDGLRKVADLIGVVRKIAG
jgi:hypothetical protein